MTATAFRTLGLVVSLALAICRSAGAEQHRATHLGNLSTRFAPTLVTPADLRARFADLKLQPDVAEILHQWGWTGTLNDLFLAAATNEISAVEIPVGTTMPFMSSRENGHPVCLRNVLWAGKLPISAYAFYFSSQGERYRCVTPKPCSNFFLEDLGPEPKPVLALDCSVPGKIPVGRVLPVCLTVHNLGNATESNILVSLLVPAGLAVTNFADGGVAAADHLSWTISSLAPDASRLVCATFVPNQIGPVALASTASGAISKPAQSSCSTTVFGIPAILLEKADDPDPVSVGDTTTYTVKVTNQGTADDSRVQVVVAIAPELAPLTSSEGTIDGNTVTLPVVPKLAPKQAVTYKIVAKGMIAGDGHTKFTLSSDVLRSPISAEESTTVY